MFPKRIRDGTCLQSARSQVGGVASQPANPRAQGEEHGVAVDGDLQAGRLPGLQTRPAPGPRGHVAESRTEGPGCAVTPLPGDPLASPRNGGWHVSPCEIIHTGFLVSIPVWTLSCWRCSCPHLKPLTIDGCLEQCCFSLHAHSRRERGPTHS